MSRPIGVALVGAGNHGQAYANALTNLRNCTIRRIHDSDDRPRRNIRWFVPTATSDSLGTILSDESIDALVITGPLGARPDYLHSALAADKHVLVESPLGMTTEEILELTAYANQRSMCLSIDNCLTFDPALRRLKSLIDAGMFGEMLYLRGSHRVLTQSVIDSDVLSWLGTRQIGAILYLLEDTPVSVCVRSESYLSRDAPDIVFCLLRFANGVMAYLHLSRLDPQTTERLSLVGSRHMAVYDGTAGADPLTLFAHTIPPAHGEGSTDVRTVERGDVVIPQLPMEDPIALQCESFLAALRRGRGSQGEPRSAETRLAVNIAAVLEGLQDSIAAEGAEMPIAPPARQPGNLVMLTRH